MEEEEEGESQEEGDMLSPGTIESQQQKEKLSFLEDLRKQSFVVSDNSTNKLDGQGNLNITDI